MTNYENLMKLNLEEMGWFLMARNMCDCCAYMNLKNQYDENGEWISCREYHGKSCISGYTEWLARESTHEDLRIFEVARHNARVSRENDAQKKNEIYTSYLDVLDAGELIADDPKRARSSDQRVCFMHMEELPLMENS